MAKVGVELEAINVEGIRVFLVAAISIARDTKPATDIIQPRIPGGVLDLVAIGVLVMESEGGGESVGLESPLTLLACQSHGSGSKVKRTHLFYLVDIKAGHGGGIKLQCSDNKNKTLHVVRKGSKLLGRRDHAEVWMGKYSCVLCYLPSGRRDATLAWQDSKP